MPTSACAKKALWIVLGLGLSISPLFVQAERHGAKALKHSHKDHRHKPGEKHDHSDHEHKPGEKHDHWREKRKQKNPA